MSGELLSIVDCHSSYGETQVLRGVSLEMERGQVTALVGRNGMGKTTLVRSIIGLNSPTEGTITFLGNRVDRMTPERISRLGIGLVPQGRGIFPSLRVFENLRVVSRSSSGSRSALENLYQRFPKLQERSRSWGDQLSGGEQQMLAIARALVNKPALVLMDEPFEGLAPIIVREVLDIIRDIVREGTGVLLVEQHVHAALEVADQVSVMGKGVIVFNGTPDEFRAKSDIQSAYLGAN
jgi:branched-chain amino acid transport system ATP-binding protein